MQTTILWTGREYYSLENCLVNTTETGSEISSTIIGLYENKIYKVEYRIHTNRNWETLSAEIHSRCNNQIQSIKLEGDGYGNWLLNGTPDGRLKDCIDIDIPLTPFTNTLPINRLNLSPGRDEIIRVIYVDILNQTITPVKQKYTRLSDVEYQYENVPNDFEATIKVDEVGLVVDYPSLFVRTSIQHINH